MTERDSRRLVLSFAAVKGFCSAVARAVVGWLITHILDRG